jgi:hypothetical protein
MKTTICLSYVSEHVAQIISVRSSLSFTYRRRDPSTFQAATTAVIAAARSPKVPTKRASSQAVVRASPRKSLAVAKYNARDTEKRYDDLTSKPVMDRKSLAKDPFIKKDDRECENGNEPTRGIENGENSIYLYLYTLSPS